MKRVLGTRPAARALRRSPRAAARSTAREAKWVSSGGSSAAETLLFRIVGRNQTSRLRVSVDAASPKKWLIKSGSPGGHPKEIAVGPGTLLRQSAHCPKPNGV